jgi:hypothetical protein
MRKATKCEIDIYLQWVYEGNYSNYTDCLTTFLLDDCPDSFGRWHNAGKTRIFGSKEIEALSKQLD